jgi:hypothetical protein
MRSPQTCLANARAASNQATLSGSPPARELPGGVVIVGRYLMLHAIINLCYVHTLFWVSHGELDFN